MNRSIASAIALAVAAIASGPVLADTSKTRAQVEAEFHAAKAAGQIVSGEAQPDAVVASQANVSRAQVLAELQAAQRAGQIVSGEASLAPVVAASPAAQPALTRAQVQAEVQAAQRSGELSNLRGEI